MATDAETLHHIFAHQINIGIKTFIVSWCKGMQKKIHLKENTCTHLGSIPNKCIKNGERKKATYPNDGNVALS